MENYLVQSFKRIFNIKHAHVILIRHLVCKRTSGTHVIKPTKVKKTYSYFKNVVLKKALPVCEIQGLKYLKSTK